MSQLLNISSLLFAVIPIGAVGLTRYISSYYSEKKLENINYLLKKLFIINLPISIIVSLILFLFSKSISQMLYSSDHYWNLILLFSFSVPFGLVSSFIDLYLKGLRIIPQYVKFVSYGSILGLGVFIPLLVFYNLEGAVIAIGVSNIINILVGIILLKKMDLLPNFSKTIEVQSGIISNIFKIGIAIMLQIAIQQLSFLYAKSILSDKLGLHDVGLYQSVYTISNSYFGLFFIVVATYSIPKLSTFKTNSETINEINQTLKLVILIYTPLIILCFVFREYLIRLLYTRDFLSAQDLLYYELQGDFLRAFSWVFSLWLIPNLRIKEVVIFDFIFYFVFISIFLYGLYFMEYGLRSITIAYLIAYVVHLFINLSYTKYQIKFKFSDRNLFILITSCSLVFVTFYLALINLYLGYYIVFPVLIIWIFLAIKKSEISQIKSFIVEKLIQRN